MRTPLFSAARLFAWFRERRLRRLRRRASYLEQKVELFRRFPHSLGFHDLERVAKEERRLRRVLIAIGMVELHARFGERGPPRAKALDVEANSSEPH